MIWDREGSQILRPANIKDEEDLLHNADNKDKANIQTGRVHQECVAAVDKSNDEANIQTSRVHQEWAATEDKGNEVNIQTSKVHQEWTAPEDKWNIDNSNKEDLWHGGDDK